MGFDFELYAKYGERNIDGYYISDHERWHYYAQRPKLYKRKKIIAYLWIIIPIAGIVIVDLSFEEMGLSLL